VAEKVPSRSTRSRPAKPALSRDAILDAAIPILRSEGLDALNMRRLAHELDTGAASLYVYFENARALQAALFDRVAGTIPLPKPDKRIWRKQLKQLLIDIVKAMDAHPGIARVPIANIPTGENAMAISDVMIALMKAGGLQDQVIAWAIDLFGLYTTAIAYETSIYVEESGGKAEAEAEIHGEIHDQFRQISPDRFPNVVGLLDALMFGDGEQRFNFGIEVLIDGLISQSRKDAP
jgi:AcrR family transcriptional regulator